MNREHYIKNLTKYTCSVIFTKNDGSTRTMVCTLNEKEIPKDRIPSEKRKTNLDSVPVWDLEKNDWRSFRVDSVEKFIVHPIDFVV